MESKPFTLSIHLLRQKEILLFTIFAFFSFSLNVCICPRPGWSSFTPTTSRVPWTMWYLTSGKSLTLSLTKTTKCSSRGQYQVYKLEFQTQRLIVLWQKNSKALFTPISIEFSLTIISLFLIQIIFKNTIFCLAHINPM